MPETKTAPAANSLSSMVDLVAQLPDDDPRKLELEYALGLKQRPAPNPFKVMSKQNEKTSKWYEVIAIEGAKVQISPKTAKLIIDHLEQFAEAIAEAEQVASKRAAQNVASNGSK